MKTGILAIGLFLAPALARGATPCNDCCQLPCVEAEIRLATKMQAWYRSQTSTRLTPDAYEAAEQKKGEELAAERQRDVGGLAACKWHMPDPHKDQMLIKKWNGVRWGVTEDKDGTLHYNFPVKTDPKTCRLREDQLELLRDIVPCAAMAAATEKHEQFHVDSCNARGGRDRSPAEVARDEVAAYDAELKELNALRAALEKVCQKGSCKDKDTKVVKPQLEKELAELKKQLARRGGK